MPTSAPGSSRGPARRRSAGFTLLELMVVVAIVAIAAAGVSFALRDTDGLALEREGERLAALLESARARSRLTGQPVRWVATEAGFRFEGLPRGALPEQWLSAHTQVVGRGLLVLGPDPVLGPQAVELTSAARRGATLRIATDGLRPFAVSPGPP